MISIPAGIVSPAQKQGFPTMCLRHWLLPHIVTGVVSHLNVHEIFVMHKIRRLPAKVLIQLRQAKQCCEPNLELQPRSLGQASFKYVGQQIALQMADQARLGNWANFGVPSLCHRGLSQVPWTALLACSVQPSLHTPSDRQYKHLFLHTG